MKPLRPLLFLDVDGVLNSWASFNGGSDIDDSCVQRLQRIIAEGDPAIVLSSTWRKYPPLAKRIWKIVGHRLPATPDGYSGRGEQIAVYLNCDRMVRNGHSRGGIATNRPFVIVDDDVFDLLPEQMPFVVRTDSMVGLTDENTAEIIKLLKGFPDIDK